MLRYHDNNFKFPLLNFRGIIPSLELVSVDSGNVDKINGLKKTKTKNRGHDDIGMRMLAEGSPLLNLC